MRFEISSQPTAEPVTIAEATAHMNYATLPTDQDSLVRDLITAARTYCEQRNHRQYVTATWKAYLDEWATCIEIKDKLPIASVSSIQYVDADGTTQTWASSSYEVDCVSPDKPCRIMAADGVAYPTLDSNIYNAITITFVAGYGTAANVPFVVKSAIKSLVDHWYHNRGPVITGTTASEIPMMIDAMLSANDWGWYG